MRAVVALSLALAACSGSRTTPPGGPPGAPDADLCAGRGCETASGLLTLTVLDAATMTPVSSQPSFLSSGYDGPMPFGCSAATSPCPSWQLAPSSALVGGTYTIDVVVAGYTTGQVTVTLAGPTSCCGAGPDVSATVTLAR